MAPKLRVAPKRAVAKTVVRPSGKAKAKAKARGSGARVVIAVVPSSGLADKGVILKEGGETYHADLNLVDAAKNHDKFYRMQVVVSKDKSKCWFVQHWGRSGTTGQTQVKGPTSKDAAVKMLLSKFRQKAGVKFEERGTRGAAAPGSTASTGKYEMLNRRLAAAKAGRSTAKGSVGISLMWNNRGRDKNDLDLHVTPPSGRLIFYGRKKSKCKGELDVDRRENCKDPVENVVWKAKAPRGQYKIEVVNFSGNHTKPVQFDVGICVDGGETKMISKAVGGKERAKVLVKTLKY